MKAQALVAEVPAQWQVSLFGFLLVALLTLKGALL